jgi:hypothetical protein
MKEPRQLDLFEVETDPDRKKDFREAFYAFLKENDKRVKQMPSWMRELGGARFEPRDRLR